MLVKLENVSNSKNRYIFDSSGLKMEGPPLRVLYRRISYFNGQLCKVYRNGLVQSGTMNLIPYGKRLIIKMPGKYLVVFFGMSGVVKEKKLEDESPNLVIKSERSDLLYFYRCAISQKTPDEFSEYYDPRRDIMDQQWDPALAISKIRALRHTEMITSDILLDQDIFCGSGNIIKNEVMWRTRVNPERKVSEIDDLRISEIVNSVKEFSNVFYNARLNHERLSGRLYVYRKRFCPLCLNKISTGKIGITKRITFWCVNCQTQ
ncbi:MAG: hypothetical protein AAE987_06970 [Thermoplasmataceae archaeon]|jgi:endonuclease-8